MPRTAVAEPSNRLLDRLPAKDRARVLAGCEQVKLSFGEVLAEPGDAVQAVYFPTASYVSLLASMEEGKKLEISITGSEGLYGAQVALGIRVSAVRAMVQGSGAAWRMSTSAFRQELAELPALRTSVDGYLYVLMGQLGRTAGCNRFHLVEQRLARWLLTVSDRAHSNTFPVTHETLASMLGIRRVGVTKAACALHARKLIRYKRGVVVIRDRKGLEAAACPCYRADLATYNAVFG